MTLAQLLRQPISQAEMAGLVGVSPARISQLVGDGTLVRDECAGAWLLAYCERLRLEAAGRAASGDLDLTTERALLARAQREAQEIKNEVARGTYAPIALLAEVLANASKSIADHLDALPAKLAKTCPDLPDDARTTLMATLAVARNGWVAATRRLAVPEVETVPQDEDEEVDPASAGGPDLDDDEVQP
ncbi:hypothetical protein RQP53_03605 [Paucibacter sp. APW11]|uniref:DNA packaging protein n=1 Tax=Roseateles aquae TaxID=3077235 RepID=A0ABU3P701_9BURK|nr:hypothetical protein [Paucibacter sp. APW11]MDT8998359.1 hypothetical protein [Paucibacter sp. APW11]